MVHINKGPSVGVGTGFEPPGSLGPDPPCSALWCLHSESSAAQRDDVSGLCHKYKASHKNDVSIVSSSVWICWSKITVTFQSSVLVITQELPDKYFTYMSRYVLQKTISGYSCCPSFNTLHKREIVTIFHFGSDMVVTLILDAHLGMVMVI